MSAWVYIVHWPLETLYDIQCLISNRGDVQKNRERIVISNSILNIIWFSLNRHTLHWIKEIHILKRRKNVVFTILWKYNNISSPYIDVGATLVIFEQTSIIQMLIFFCQTPLSDILTSLSQIVSQMTNIQFDFLSHALWKMIITITTFFLKQQWWKET